MSAIPAIPPERLQHTRRLMELALPEARISGFHRHIGRLELPDPDDRHVVAAAIEAKASVILTWNQRDFPMATLKKHGLAGQAPDEFLVSLYERAAPLVVISLANARRHLSTSGVSARQFLDVLTAQKLTGLAQRLQRHAADL
jgi:hypothetical protein